MLSFYSLRFTATLGFPASLQTCLSPTIRRVLAVGASTLLIVIGNNAAVVLVLHYRNYTYNVQRHDSVPTP